MEARLTLKQMILNVIDNQPRGYAEILAPIAGYASGSNLKKVLRNEEKEFDNFNGLVNLVRYLFPEDELKLMEEYSKTLDPCNKSARCMLEYLCNNRILDSLKELIDKMLKCNNKESQEWAKVYSVQYEWQVNYYSLNVNNYLNTLKEIRTNIPELKTYIKILTCYGYYFKKLHKVAYELSQEIIYEVNQIKDEYLKDIFNTKLNEVLSYIHLRVKNNPVEARNRAMTILDSKIGKTHKAYAYYTIGCSYFYESYDSAKENFLKSIDVYKAIKRENAALDIEEISELLDIIWDKDIKEIKLRNEYRLYWEIKNNLVNEFDINEIEMDKPYYYLLKGMRDNDTEVLMQSMIHFLKCGDSFFANLPKIELQRRNYSTIIINELINLYDI